MKTAGDRTATVPPRRFRPFTIAETNGQLNYEDCSIEFRRKCVNGREMVNTINYLFDNIRLNEYWSDKLNNTKELVATQLKGY